MVIHSMSGTNTLDDLRFTCKKMASILLMRSNINYGSYPMRRMTEKVCDGDILLFELQEWYPKAVRLLNSSPYGRSMEASRKV